MQILLRSNTVPIHIQVRWFRQPQTHNIHFRPLIRHDAVIQHLSEKYLQYIHQLKLGFYLQEAECKIHCDHKLLEQFIEAKLKKAAVGP